MAKKFEIRNSTAEFLTFVAEGKEDGIQVVYQDETIWVTQQAMGELFDVKVPTINYHLSQIFKDGELQEDRTIRKIRIVQQEGTRNVEREPMFYNLDAIISVGYRVNSIRATQFRQWCTYVLRQYAIRGYVIDKKRMENGSFIGEDYFEHLLAEIREIRLSERRFYQKLTDIYATSIDYNKDAPTTRLFYRRIQNKMHYAVHQHTAAELIVERADAEKEHMGRIVTAVLEFAESRAKRHIPMTMEDWAKRIDAYLTSDERPMLADAGTVSHDYAKRNTQRQNSRSIAYCRIGCSSRISIGWIAKGTRH